MSFDPRDIIRCKRDGAALSGEQARTFLEAYVAGEVSDAQATALLASIFLHGMEPEELVWWTDGMLATGEELTWDLDRPVVDKHSTGGVGDKTSLVLAPALAACGAAVPMISGRGLGHTGGTLDKLEAFEGLSTELSLEDLRRVVGEVGCVIAAQSAELVPADRGLYALRDATGLVESLPLIASSILSKKMAEGLDALVLDVKYGTGSFLSEIAEGETLAGVMLDLARRKGLRARILHTAMDQPLGMAVGHALEVAECIEVMRAGGPEDLRLLVLELGGELLAAAGLTEGVDEGRTRLQRSLEDGSALDVFDHMVDKLGGDPAALPRTRSVDMWLAPASGVLDVVDCRAIGRAALALGGGRRAPADRIDPAVGVRWMRRVGDEVRAGELLAELHHAGSGVEQAQAELAAAIDFDTGRAPSPLVHARYG
ncbi:MAG: thymidine phosphorylase [Planctomycetota bacterium]|nr:thymidine phosphorylase [Planctomycetota bacterium]